jgi:hypothetical protein
MTDSYSRGWRVTPLEDHPPQDYPRRSCELRRTGIALRAGHHRIQLEYAPRGFLCGRWVFGGVRGRLPRGSGGVGHYPRAAILGERPHEAAELPCSARLFPEPGHALLNQPDLEGR